MGSATHALSRHAQPLRRERTILIAEQQAPLFCNRTGGKLRRAYIRRLMPQLAAKAGIGKRVHAHGLRHTHAAELRAEGVDIGIISKQLGHTSIATTVRYLDHIAPVAVVEAMRGREWGGYRAASRWALAALCGPLA
jgi:site-specific recombinase XerD